MTAIPCTTAVPEGPARRVPLDLSTEPTWGMTAPSPGRVSPMAVARTAVPRPAGDGASVLDGFLRAEGLFSDAGAMDQARRATLEASAHRWYRFGRTSPRLAADLDAASRGPRVWRAFAAEVRGLGISVAAVRAMASRVIAESDALRLYLEAEGLGTLRQGRFDLDGAHVERDLDTARRGLQRLGYRWDRALALADAGAWAAPRVAQFEVATATLLAVLAAVRSSTQGGGAEVRGVAVSLCDQIADLAVRATGAALDHPPEDTLGFGGLAFVSGQFPYRERIASLCRRLAAVLAPALSPGSSLVPDPRPAGEAFTETLGALREALGVLALRLDDYTNDFGNRGAHADRAALGAHAAGTAPCVASACAHLARIQATHSIVAGLVGILAARQAAVADARERLLAYASTRAGQVGRDALPEPVAAVDLFYFSVTRGLSHLVADLDARQSELAAPAAAFTSLLDKSR